MLIKLDHINILTLDMSGTMIFYGDLLGLRPGWPATLTEKVDRSKFVWFYDASGAPAVHVQAVDPGAPNQTLDRTRARLGALAGALDAESLVGSGAIEHVAFQCQDYDGVRQRLTAAGCPLRFNEALGGSLRQIFVNDPNGLTLELNFRTEGLPA